LSDLAVVDILKHVSRRPKFLILDEALEKISPHSIGSIVDLLLQIRSEGTAIILITHKIDDVYKFANRVSIMRDGSVLLTDDVNNVDKLTLMRLTYTQLFERGSEAPNHEFYEFLRYNEAILQNLPVNLIIIDLDNRIKIINQACLNSFRLSRQVYLNRPIAFLLEKDNARISALLSEVVSNREEKVFYGEKVVLNQIEAICNIKIVPIFEVGDVIGNIIVFEDVSENDNLQRKIVLSEKLASVGLLGAGVAHEINNPLEIITNFIRYMKFNFQNRQLLAIVDKVQEEVSSIANIVSNLVSFSENDLVGDEDFSIEEVVRVVVDLLKYNANYNRVRIVFQRSGQNPTIRARKNEVKQVLLNLFKNSFEAMPEGGIVEINSRVAEESGETFVELLFADSGTGIDEKNPNNIFLPFYSRRASKGANLGLGLYVSYGIVTKLHGTIAVKNRPQGGTEFTIQLPVVGFDPVNRL
jgi:PAS domain S-box-containing protein